MGCVNSKQKRCKHCKAPYSPVRRSYSMHVVHALQEAGDDHHVVSLTSTTLGSLSLDSCHQNVVDRIDVVGYCTEIVKSEDFVMDLIEAKTWSDMIRGKIVKTAPRTPILTPPGELETINTWELMTGLEEDSSPVHLSQRFSSLSFDASHDHYSNSNSNNEHTWLRVVNEEDPALHCHAFDSETIFILRKSLSDCDKHSCGISLCEDILVKPAYHEAARKEEVILYFTSLRGIRKTYEDCCEVLQILKSLGVKVDERDVSMHSGFKEELRELLSGEGLNGAGLPRVFLGSKYIGGAEEVWRMHEAGQLEKALEGCEMVGASQFETCEVCGDVRFVPCETCSGSCKKLISEEDQEHEQEFAENPEFGFRRCPDCNENGLIRCPACCC